MKTIEEEAKEQANALKIYSSKQDFEKGFKAGVEFAQRWIPVEEELPEENGRYLVLRSNGDWTSTYFRVSDKSFVNYFSDAYCFTHWRPIELK